MNWRDWKGMSGMMNGINSLFGRIVTFIKNSIESLRGFVKTKAWIEKRNVEKSKADSNSDKWIQGAVKKPGALHNALGVPMDKKIPAKKLAIKATDSPLMKKRKNLAKTFKKMRSK
jgi:hypothetical protein